MSERDELEQKLYQQALAEAEESHRQHGGDGHAVRYQVREPDGSSWAVIAEWPEDESLRPKAARQ